MKTAAEILASRRHRRPAVSPLQGYRSPVPDTATADAFAALAAFLHPDDMESQLECAIAAAEEGRRQGYPRCRTCRAKTFEPCPHRAMSSESGIIHEARK